MKTEHQQRIEEMMRRAGQELPAVPTVPPPGVRVLRARLILEEALETIRALGVHVWLPDDESAVDLADPDIFQDLRFQANSSPDLPGIVDGCADVSVVTIGTLSACGVSDDAVLREVDENNQKKFGPGGYRDEHGKWRKPPGHKPPDIEACLREQGWVEESR